MILFDMLTSVLHALFAFLSCSLARSKVNPRLYCREKSVVKSLNRNAISIVCWFPFRVWIRIHTAFEYPGIWGLVVGKQVPVFRRTLLLPSEYGGSRVLRNVGTHLPDNAATGPGRLWYAYLYSSSTFFFFWMGGVHLVVLPTVHCITKKFCCSRALPLAASRTTIVENGTLVEYWLARKGRNALRMCDQCHFVHPCYGS